MKYITRASLLSRVCKGDEVSWEEFYNSYKKLLGYVGKHVYFLNDHDIKDLIQEVMLFFFSKGTEFKYDPSKGKMRGYLKRVFYYKVMKLREQKRRHNGGQDEESVYESDDLIDNLPEPKDSALDNAWNSEWRKLVIDQSLHDLKETVEPQTFQIFHHLVIEEIPPQEVADAFQTTVNNVYAIKSRLAKKVSDHAQEYMDECVNF